MTGASRLAIVPAAAGLLVASAGVFAQATKDEPAKKPPARPPDVTITTPATVRGRIEAIGRGAEPAKQVDVVKAKAVVITPARGMVLAQPVAFEQRQRLYRDQYLVTFRPSLWGEYALLCRVGGLSPEQRQVAAEAGEKAR